MCFHQENVVLETAPWCAALPPDWAQSALLRTSQATLRHGCLCLTITALLSPAELQQLHSSHPSGLAASVAAAVAKAQAASGAPAPPLKLLVSTAAAMLVGVRLRLRLAKSAWRLRLLQAYTHAAAGCLLTASGSCLLLLQVQAGSQLAAANAHHGVIAAQLLPARPGSTAAQLLAAPRLVTPPVLCSESSSLPIQLVLVGPALADPNVTLHCRSRGRHQVVTVLGVRRSGTAAAAADGPQEPPTPPTADRPSADSDCESDSEGAWAPSAAGPAVTIAPEAPTAAEAAFAAVHLAAGEDALLVQLAAPAQGWGLFEFEVAAGEQKRQAWLSCAPCIWLAHVHAHIRRAVQV